MMWPVLLIVASSSINHAPPQLALSLGPKTQTIRLGKQAKFQIDLHNIGKTVCVVVDARDGSIEHWVTPSVGWSVLKDPDAEHPLFAKPLVGARCGNVNPIFGKDIVSLKPNESFRLGTNGWPQHDFIPMWTEPGTYRVAFYYRNEPRKLHKMEFDSLPDAKGARKKLLQSYPCTLRSNEVTVIVEPRSEPPRAH